LSHTIFVSLFVSLRIGDEPYNIIPHIANSKANAEATTRWPTEVPSNPEHSVILYLVLILNWIWACTNTDWGRTPSSEPRSVWKGLSRH